MAKFQSVVSTHTASIPFTARYERKQQRADARANNEAGSQERKQKGKIPPNQNLCFSKAKNEEKRLSRNFGCSAS